MKYMHFTCHDMRLHTHYSLPACDLAYMQGCACADIIKLLTYAMYACVRVCVCVRVCKHECMRVCVRQFTHSGAMAILYSVYWWYVCTFSPQWQFLTRDEGERDTATDPSWTEDEGTWTADHSSHPHTLTPSRSHTLTPYALTRTCAGSDRLVGARHYPPSQ